MLRKRNSERLFRVHPRLLVAADGTYRYRMTTPGRSNKLQYAPTGLPALLTIAEVAQATGVCPRTIRRWIADGALRAHRIGPRFIRIERDSVLALLDSPVATS
jgi:excisionase family DNA binding protein